MRRIRSSSSDEVAYFWLKSEWHKDGVASDAESHLVSDATLGDRTLNAQRRRKLREVRGALVDEIPIESSFSLVDIEVGDLADLFLLPTWDWFMDTDGSFRLSATLTNLAPGRGATIRGFREPICHYERVHEILPVIEQRSPDEYLVLVAASGRPPYTIIDGTHRATALLRIGENTMPWRAFLVESSKMDNYPWHIDSLSSPSVLRQLHASAAAGQLW